MLPETLAILVLATAILLLGRCRASSHPPAAVRLFAGAQARSLHPRVKQSALLPGRTFD